ncbi:uncharacterized protein LY79DRAFT_514163 [Colletotrichum navitas]|uniref:Uncharacterized protein n=1 Tax=Colletotrichum navitas TaxID=681940 RepID=A0AAD8Q0I9_9PEZI|nr:uncharacterized protein LY79DRAFT_514163 [Colletotrichum navitas]KAK1593428.1 hypothetical protein LY79DRAFT_514163 [Colletotrichum navitas]
MLGYQLLTLALTAAAAATPGPSNPSASLGGAGMEGIIPHEDHEAAIASAGTDRMRALAEERICDLTLCSGVNLSGECSRWCYYRNRPQIVPIKQRLGTLSAHYETAIECWFYSYVRALLFLTLCLTCTLHLAQRSDV